ncbi:hypothetical protein LEP1GSC061_2969 [Leptospira wolffii serovar Khorat str. Khorat-H2]|nr:hypothetical protein LEP1GSC061_2969 [Leptospira wolffii serovar Khorat str. Khorat-H2]
MIWLVYFSLAYLFKNEAFENLTFLCNIASIGLRGTTA